jgi:hypothetical protein
MVNEALATLAPDFTSPYSSIGRSAIDGRTTRHAGYAISQRIRKRIEEGFGWMKLPKLMVASP